MKRIGVFGFAVGLAVSVVFWAPKTNAVLIFFSCTALIVAIFAVRVHRQNFLTNRMFALAVCDQSSMGLMVLSQDHRVLWSNTLAQRIRLCASVEKLNELFSEHVASSQNTALKNFKFGSQFQLTTAFGEEHYIVETVPMPHSPFGKNVFLMFLHEISEFVHASQKLELALSGQKELSSNLEKVLKSREDFTSVISHELRTPLQAISGWANLLASGVLPEEKRARALQSIVRNAQVESLHVDSLLAISRLDLEMNSFDKHFVNVIPIVKEILGAFESVSKNSNARIQFSTCSEALNARVNLSMFRLIVWHLLCNAGAPSCSSGSISFCVMKQSNQLQLKVSAWGTRIDNTIHSSTLGLGLRLVEKYVAAHGGALEAIGKDSCDEIRFFVELPLEEFVDKSEPKLPIQIQKISGQNSNQSDSRIHHIMNSQQANSFTESVYHRQNVERTLPPFHDAQGINS
jgi:signal transduction histidine kinase